MKRAIIAVLLAVLVLLSAGAAAYTDAPTSDVDRIEVTTADSTLDYEQTTSYTITVYYDNGTSADVTDEADVSTTSGLSHDDPVNEVTAVSDIQTTETITASYEGVVTTTTTVDTTYGPFLGFADGDSTTITKENETTGDEVEFIGNTTNVSGGAYELSGASFGNKLNISNEVLFQGTTDVAFNGDGTKVYIVDSSNDVGTHGVISYDLSTPYDISSATHLRSFNSSPNVVTYAGVDFNDDGTKMYIGGGDAGNPTIDSFTLSDPYNISTASFANTDSLSGPDDDIQIQFRDNGNRLFVIAGSADIWWWDLSTAYDITTLGTANSYSTEYFALSAMSFNNDGTKMYLGGAGDTTIKEYDLSTAYDPSSLSATGKTYDPVDEDGQTYAAYGFVWNNDASKFYAGNDDDALYSYITGDAEVKTQDPQLDVDDDGVFEASYSGTLNDSESVNVSVSENVTAGDHLMTIDTAAGVVDWKYKAGSAIVGENKTFTNSTDVTALAAQPISIQLDAPEEMGYNETQAYAVLVTYENDSQLDKTGSSTVQSSDTAILAVDATNETLVSSDTGGIVTMNATYDTFEDNQTVTVAEINVQDCGLIGGECMLAIGSDWTYLYIFAALLIGAMGTRLFGEMAGFGITVSLMFVGWVPEATAGGGPFVSTWVLIATLYWTIFIGVIKVE